MLYALLLGAALVAAATPLDTRHAALLDALTSDSGGMSCPPGQLRTAAADATIQSVGRVDGDDVVVAHLNGGCLCGAHNCPVYTLRLTAAKPRILMTTFGYGVSMRADSPLPRIVVRSNVNSLISNEETYAYRGGRYVDIENARVRGDTGARKVDIAVRFAPGASSAQLVGSASRDWDDAYTFDAEKGQLLLIDAVSSRAKIALTLSSAKGGLSDIRPGKPVTLPVTGTYWLRVQTDAEQTVPYAFVLAIAAHPAPQQTGHGAGANASTAQPVPDATLMRWAQSLPEVRCVPAAFDAWSGVRTSKDTSGVPTTLIGGQRFAHSAFSRTATATRVAGVERSDSDRYYLARIPSAGAALMEFIGAGDEDSFSAVIASINAPPRAVVTLPSAPRAGGTLGLGSTRAAVESMLGPGRAKALCGFDVVHYSQSQPRASVAEMWFFYRGGVVTAITYISGV